MFEEIEGDFGNLQKVEIELYIMKNKKFSGQVKTIGLEADSNNRTFPVEVEVENISQVKEALDAGAEILLLDNMAPEKMAQAVDLCQGRALTEASGGINLSSVRAAAESGVNLISVGALTHSAPDLDLSLDIE